MIDSCQGVAYSDFMPHISEINIASAQPRLEEVARLRLQRLTFAEIGVKLGVSRQRAAQLVARARERGLIEDGARESGGRRMQE